MAVSKPFVPTVCVDFDGVIHEYSSKWVDAVTVLDPPVEGAFAWLKELMEAGFLVVVSSTRFNDARAIDAVRAWFIKHGMLSDTLERLSFSLGKPLALMYVDDRGWRFEGPGTFPTAEQIRFARPWNRR